MKLRYPDIVSIYAEGRQIAVEGQDKAALGDAQVWFEQPAGSLRVLARAEETALKYIALRWIFTDAERRREPVRVLGDEWERGYGRMEWRGIVPERCMPWTVAVSNGSDADRDVSGRFTECFGVKVRPTALCFWQYDQRGVTLWLDVRNGGNGVRLKGRTLAVCDVVFGEYRNDTAFHAIHAFYASLCDDRIEPPFKVYGSNNWYYADGKSSHEEILSDAKLVSDLCAGLENRPFMVIDDGWQPNPTNGPWDRGNERFPDMKSLAERMKALGARPGIWIRYLGDEKQDTPGILPEHRLSRNEKYLDPSHPSVLEKVREDTRRIVNDWGFELIKHDFSTYDIFGDWGVWRATTLTDDGWFFYDRTKTSAEIVVNFYRAIREAAGENTILIGCNVIGHLAAGLVHLNRTGDDTSGREWERTRKMGVNTLAFRMLHDKTFFAADADCVGITEAVDWRLNREWLRALSVSGTPLFVSCKPGVPDEAALNDLRQAFSRASRQEDALEPVDWMETTCPGLWRLNGEPVSFDWYPPMGAEAFRP